MAGLPHPLRATPARHRREPGGGGHGNPFERDTRAVAEDVKNGIVSIPRARSDYGVVVDEQTGEVNEDATRTLRTTGGSKEAADAV